jgi:hypothetical protein
VTQRKFAIIATAAIGAGSVIGFWPAPIAVLVLTSDRRETVALLSFTAIYAVAISLAVWWCLQCPNCGAFPKPISSVIHSASRRCERCGFNFTRSG